MSFNSNCNNLLFNDLTVNQLLKLKKQALIDMVLNHPYNPFTNEDVVNSSKKQLVYKYVECCIPSVDGVMYSLNIEDFKVQLANW